MVISEYSSRTMRPRLITMIRSHKVNSSGRSDDEILLSRGADAPESHQDVGVHGAVARERHVVLAEHAQVFLVDAGPVDRQGGAVGIAPHITIGRGAMLAARSGVIGDVPAGETWGGYPARPRTQWMREQATLARLASRQRKDANADGD